MNLTRFRTESASELCKYPHICPWRSVAKRPCLRHETCCRDSPGSAAQRQQSQQAERARRLPATWPAGSRWLTAVWWNDSREGVVLQLTDTDHSLWVGPMHQWPSWPRELTTGCHTAQANNLWWSLFFVIETEYSIQYIKSIYKIRKIKKNKKVNENSKKMPNRFNIQIDPLAGCWVRHKPI